MMHVPGKHLPSGVRRAGRVSRMMRRACADVEGMGALYAAWRERRRERKRKRTEELEKI
jgi:hypothetical protein